MPPSLANRPGRIAASARAEAAPVGHPGQDAAAHVFGDAISTVPGSPSISTSNVEDRAALVLLHGVRIAAQRHERKVNGRRPAVSPGATVDVDRECPTGCVPRTSAGSWSWMPTIRALPSPVGSISSARSAGLAGGRGRRRRRSTRSRPSASACARHSRSCSGPSTSSGSGSGPSLTSSAAAVEKRQLRPSTRRRSTSQRHSRQLDADVDGAARPTICVVLSNTREATPSSRGSITATVADLDRLVGAVVHLDLRLPRGDIRPQLDEGDGRRRRAARSVRGRDPSAAAQPARSTLRPRRAPRRRGVSLSRRGAASAHPFTTSRSTVKSSRASWSISTPMPWPVGTRTWPSSSTVGSVTMSRW